MGTCLGHEVGYTVRFEDATSHRTGVRYLTEGVLIRWVCRLGCAYARELARSSNTEDGEGLDLLLRYDVVVIDEAHERTLNTDFLCGTLKKIQRIRKLLSEGSHVEVLDRKANGESKDKARDIRPLKIVVMSATLDPSKFTRFFET
jgi:ATP-dependent RNA helicase DHX33